MKVIAFNGSAREKGNTFILLKNVLEEIEKEGIETELIELWDKKIKGCKACYKCYANKNKKCSVNDDFANECIEKILLAEGVLLGSPTYFADVSTTLKALIERVGFVARANNNLFKRKVGAAVVMARRGGAIHAFDTINHFFLISEMIIAGSNYWNIGIGKDPKEVENDQEGIQTMKTLGKNISWLLKKICK